MFRLQRYFSLTSLVAFAVVSIALGYFYSYSATENLLYSAEKNNITVTQLFANSLWPAYADFVGETIGLDREALLAQPEIGQLYAAVEEQTQGTGVLKIKIYNMDGLVVFSTEENQIGDEKGDNLGFLAASRGEIASELSHRDTFSAFEKEIVDLDVYSSYIPIRRNVGDIEGVFEVYSDLTPLLANIAQTRTNVMAGVAALLGGLYAVLFVIVRHADKILQQQAAERILAQDELKAERANLANQVDLQTADLRQMNERLIHASKLKDQFLAMISHELRTPLTTILARTDALLSNVYGKLTESQTPVVRGVHQGGSHLLGLVSDLLDLSRSEFEKIEIEKQPIELKKLCEDSVASVQAIAEEKELRISVTQCKDDLQIVGDERRLRQVLINLLHNAAKFTPDGGLIGLDVVTDAKAQLLKIAVWDSGIGIAEHELARIFEPFTQADSRLAREYDGAGLGLALVRQLVALHDGEVTVKSTEGEGSRFEVSIPWTSSEWVAPVVPDSAETETEHTAEPRDVPLILIAEDNELNAETLVDTLQFVGFRTIVATNGLEAIDQTHAHSPDLILMDVQMPKLNGLDATRRLRKELPHHIPIIALTGYASADDKNICIEAGADAYLSKPFSIEGVSSLIDEQLAAVA